MSGKLFAGIVLAVLFFVFAGAGLARLDLGWPALTPVAATIGEAVWHVRTIDVVFQGFIILAGVAAILLLLGPRSSGRVKP